MRLQALALLSVFTLLIGFAHASLFITPPGYSTIVTNVPYPCTAVITTGGSIPATEGASPLLPSLPANGLVIGVVGIALVLSFLIIAIIYMASRLFPHLGIQGWIQSEYWEMAKSVMLIVGIFAILVFLSNVAVNVTNTPVTAFSSSVYLNNINGLLYSSETYLLTADSYVAAGWCTLGNVEFGTALLNNLNIQYYVPIPIPIILIGFKFGMGFNPLVAPLLTAGTDPNFSQFDSIIADLITLIYYPVSMIILVLIEILPALVWLGLAFFIPFGLVFRALPFLRGLGGTFLSIGIGLAVLLPTVLVVFNYPVTQAFQSILPIQSVASGSGACNFGSTILNFACTAISAVIGNGIRFVVSLYYGFSEFSGIYTVLNAILPYTMFLLVQLLLFILDIIIMYPIMDTLARSLGGTLNPLASGLGGKFKLV